MPGRHLAGIELDVICGFGAFAGDVPADLIHALKILLTHWYDNRGLAPVSGGAVIQPAGLHALIAPYRMLSL